MGTDVIEVTSLTKRFGAVVAVDGISFTVREGEVFGFLGPNGAGKTTTINVLTGLALPTSGAFRIAGVDGAHDIKRVQQRIGIVPDESNLYEELSGFDNLTFCASLYGLSRSVREQRARELLERFGLADTGSRPFRAYSKGMKRKLTIAAGIIHSPEILFLDEPTTGIDVESSRQIRDLVRSLHEAGTTIFLTTHYIEEAERLCDRIGFIAAGRIVRIGAVEELMAEDEGRHVVEFTFGDAGDHLLTGLADAFPGMEVARVDATRLRVTSPERIDLTPFLPVLERLGEPVYEARVIRRSLEDVFVRVTGIAARRLTAEKERGRRA
ncbi:MAG: ABC transporter ATP-binding protein [Actinomycetota bacterium]